MYEKCEYEIFFSNSHTVSSEKQNGLQLKINSAFFMLISGSRMKKMNVNNRHQLRSFIY